MYCGCHIHEAQFPLKITPMRSLIIQWNQLLIAIFLRTAKLSAEETLLTFAHHQLQRHNSRMQLFSLMDKSDTINQSSLCSGNMTYNAIPDRKLLQSRSTFDPDYAGGIHGNYSAFGRDQRRVRLLIELKKLGIDLNEIESHPELYGISVVRTFNSFLLPKTLGALAVAESPTRARVVANSMSFLIREHKADQERWIRNVDRNRNPKENVCMEQRNGKDTNNVHHPITIVLDNIRSAENVGNILRLVEASQIHSVRLCGMTPRPPHPKVLKTAMGSAEFVSYGSDEKSASTLHAVLNLKSQGVVVFGVETTDNSTNLWDATIPDATHSVAYVFGNELIGVDVEVLKQCDGIISLPTYGIKNSLNIATCVGIVIWETLRRWKSDVTEKKGMLT